MIEFLTVGFVGVVFGGLIITIFGKYGGDAKTDNRREKRRIKKETNNLKKCKKLYPQMIKTLKESVVKYDCWKICYIMSGEVSFTTPYVTMLSPGSSDLEGYGFICKNEGCNYHIMTAEFRELLRKYG
jgi:hypothetical protein